MRTSACFRTVLSESQDTQTHDICRSQDRLHAKWPFKVIYFDVNEKPQGLHSGFVYKSSEDIGYVPTNPVLDRPTFWQFHVGLIVRCRDLRNRR